MKTSILLFVLFVCTYASCQQPISKKPAAKNDTAYVYHTPSSGGSGKFYYGREIANIMDASGADWLERSSRSKEENTDLIIKTINLKKDMVVADIGAGTGYYTFRIAKQVTEGKVFAVEIQDELVDMLNKKKLETGTTQVEVIRGDTLSVNLPENIVDLAIMVDVYHELSWPREIINSISKSLKPDGKILLVEYRGEDLELRIKPLHKTTVEQLTREMKANGFVVDKTVDVFPIQHFMIFRKILSQ